MISKLARFFTLATVLIITASINSVAAPGPGIAQEDLKQIMPLSQVKAGMKGYGLTVFKGTKIEKFDVEVIGVLKKVNNGHDLILVKMAGGPVTARQANIIAGMSGSPVYINGKVVGAVAYGNSFPKEPLGMLTPIEDMLEALDPNLPSQPSGMSTEYAELDEPVKVNGKTYTGVNLDPDNEPVSAASETLNMRPLMTPMMVSGVSGRGIAKLNEIFKPFNVTATAGPGMGSVKVKTQMVPGAAVGLSLVTGDVDITGVGTLTYRRGNKIVAFGHPMMSIGATDAAMTSAYVHDVFPSVMVSNKIASPIEVVGRINQDRPFSIGGELGKFPKMIPVTMTVKDAGTKRSRTLNFKVINHPLLSSKMIGMVASAGIAELRPTPGDATAKVRFEVEADEIGKVQRDNVFFDPIAIADEATQDLQELLGILNSNKFYPVDVKSVKLSVEMDSKRSTANIERIFINETEYEPGDKVQVGVVIRPYKQQPVTKSVDVTIPKYVDSGRLSLQVQGGYAPMGGMMILQAGADGSLKLPSASTGGASAENVGQLVKKYLETNKNSDLTVKLLVGNALSVKGEKLSRLPGPIADIMKSTNSTGLKQEQDDIKVVVPTDYIVSGSQSLSINVKRKDHSEKGSSSKPQPSESSSGGSSSSSSNTPTIIFDDLEETDSTQDVLPVSTGAGYGMGPAEKPVIFTVAKPVPPGSYLPVPNTAAGAKPTASQPQNANQAEKYVGRGLTTWKQTSLEDFAAGTFEGTTPTTANDVRLSPMLKKAASLDAAFVWSMVADGSGGSYAGTGNDGIIYHISKDGKSSVFFKTGEIGVHSLARDASGNIIAGTSPNGKVYKISANGNGKAIFDAEEKYILSLTTSSNGTIYAGVGDSGSIYKIGSDGNDALLTSLPEPQVLSLAAGANGDIYAGTGNKGVVYKVSPTGTKKVLYAASQKSITALAVDDKGNVFAGTDGKGVLYRIAPDGSAKTLYDKLGSAVMSMAVSKSGNIYAASGDSVYRINANDTIDALAPKDDHVQFISMALDANGTVYAGTSNAGAVYVSAAGENGGTFESTVRDTKLISQWGPISWAAKLPAGTSISISTRTGDVAEPDESWSEWSAPYKLSDGDRIISPAGRFIQYRATLVPGKDGTSPELKDVTISYLPANQAPTVKITSPQGGERWGKTQTVKWSGADPDKDTLTYDLFYSSDNGATWKPLDKQVKSNGKVEPKPAGSNSGNGKTNSQPAKDSQSSAVSSNQAMARMKAELDKHPEIPQQMKDRIMAEAPDIADEMEVDDNGKTEVLEEDVDVDKEEEKEESRTPSKETSYSWNTSSIVDGVYIIKVVASDRTSNPTGHLTGEAISDPVVISNLMPKLFVFKRSITVDKDRTVKLEGYTTQSVVGITGVQYRVDNGEWMAAAPTDGMYDGKSESFSIVTYPLSRGQHTIEIKSIDNAGNAASAKTPVSIP